MQEFLTPDSIAAEIMMLRTNYVRAAFLLAEGASDARLFNKLIDKATCIVRNCYNRAKTIAIVGKLGARGFEGHLAVVDRDFGDLFGETFSSDNILVTDFNDIECMIFNTRVFGDLVNEYGTQEKVSAIENAMATPLRGYLAQQVSFIGGLRYLSREKSWNLKFDGMTIRFADRDSLSLELDRQIEHLRGRTLGTSLPSTQQAMLELSQLLERPHSTMSFVCGHDLCEFISRAIHEFLGRKDISLSRGGQAIEEIFRTAYSAEDFKNSDLFGQIKAWEAKCPPFRILPA